MTKEGLKYIHEETVEMLFQMFGKRDWDCQETNYQIALYHIQQAYEEGGEHVEKHTPTVDYASSWLEYGKQTEKVMIIKPLDFEEGVITLDKWGFSNKLLFFRWKNEHGVVVYPIIEILNFIREDSDTMYEYRFNTKNVKDMYKLGNAGLYPGNYLFIEKPKNGEI